MPSRRTLLVGVASLGAGGYYFRDHEDVEKATRTADRTAGGIIDWLDGEEWDAREAGEAAHVRVNEFRASRGLDKLSLDEQLYEIAKSYADRMVEEDFYGHEDPQGRGFEHRYEQAGYDCDANEYEGAENILQTYWQEEITDEDGDPEYLGTSNEVGVSAAESWLSSASHRKNILLDVWDGQGIGFAKTDDDTVYAVQNFC